VNGGDRTTPARVTGTIALAASAVVLTAGLWHGWSVLATGRRLVVACLACELLGVVLALAARLAPRPGQAAEAARAPVPTGPRRAGDHDGTTGGP